MATRTLAPLEPVPGFADLLTARRGAARMVAVRLPPGGVMIYSPVPDPDETALRAARALGGVRAILAPSPFHHLGVASWRSAFPEATLHALPGALPRLTERLGEAPSPTLPALPPSVGVLTPPGLKAPELWLRATGSGGVAWIVCDAFAGPAGPDEAPADTPKPRGAFATMCVGDKTVYRDWAMAQIDRDRPTRLLPAHGNAVAAPDLTAKLTALVDAL